MKKLVIWMLFPVLLIGLAGCRPSENSAMEKENALTCVRASDIDIRKVVYDQMDLADRDRMKEGWAEARVDSIILSEGMAVKSDPSYIGREVYVVDFRVKTLAIPDNMIFYATKPDGKVIGIGLVD